MKKWSFLLFLAGIGFIFWTRYLFLITVMAEERIAGGFYEPLRVADISLDTNGNLHASFIPPQNKEFLKEKRVGPFAILRRPYPVESCPLVSVRIKEKEYPVLLTDNVGALLPIYIPMAWVNLFGKSIYSIRTLLLLTFLSLFYLYTKFAVDYLKKYEEGVLVSFYLITFPILGMTLVVPYMWSCPILLIIQVILTLIIRRIYLTSSVGSFDIFFLLFLSGFMLNSHLLAGGTILASTFIAFFLSMKKPISFKANLPSMIAGVFFFLLFVLPYLFISLHDLSSLAFGGRKFPRIILLPYRSLLVLLSTIFFPSSFPELSISSRIDIRYLPFSFPSGLILLTSIIGLIMDRKKGEFEKFLFMAFIFYFVFASFGRIWPYHLTHLLLFTPVFLPSVLKRIRFLSSAMAIKIILIVGILYNVLQIEMLRGSVKNSPLSLSIHKEVADYLVENGVTTVYNLSGLYDYYLLSKGKVKTVDFLLFLGRENSREKIYLSLLFSKGKVILVEKSRRVKITTTITIDEVIEVARETGLKVEVIKNFPSDENPQLVLARVK